jgi:predicted DNA-binding ribbon-helix-helix protein
MRTTIRIDDEVYRRVKQVADRSDRTIGQVIEDAVQLAFQPRRNEVAISALPVYGGSGVMPGVDLTSNRSVAEAMDEDVPLDAMR